jgi:hypothetical protein
MNDRLRRNVVRCIAWLAIDGVSGPSAAQGLPHGNHNPHHGGVVMMYGMDLHFEIVLLPAGGISIYFSDGQRSDLPASVASDVAIEIERSGAEAETVTMTIGTTGEYWEGKSAPIKEGDATLHLAFLFHGNPILVSFPVSSLLTDAKDGRRRQERSARLSGTGGFQHE